MSWWNRQRFSLVRTVEPTDWPVTVADVRKHSRITIYEDDDQVFTWIKTATGFLESYQRRALLAQTWQLKLDYWPYYAYGDWPSGNRAVSAPSERFWEVQLPRPRLISVSSIQYIDPAGATQTWGSSNYTVDTASEPGMIYPVYGQTWPQVRAIPFPITITYVAGYGTLASAVPETSRHWIRLAAAAMSENRELESEAKLLQWMLGRSLLDAESLGDLIVQ